MSFDELPKKHFGAILADPPWHFQSWSPEHQDRKAPYETMSREEIQNLPVSSLAADDCVLFLWICWPQLEEAMELIKKWEFTYKTCAFSWIKADAQQLELFRDDVDVQVGLGYWTRANSEVCLLATKGSPKRLNADVRQAIVEPRREHSRKPDIYERIERLVGGPWCELFARNTPRPGWVKWGLEVGKFDDKMEDLSRLPNL
jgi:N6-adenosine-specific RNA methylase IME4